MLYWLRDMECKFCIFFSCLSPKNANRGRRYVWGANVHKAKTQCERFEISALYLTFDNNIVSSLDYIFQLAVEMHKLGLPWVSEI
jgi:hypothetical protein